MKLLSADKFIDLLYLFKYKKYLTFLEATHLIICLCLIC